jgi:hypothetical protein
MHEAALAAVRDLFAVVVDDVASLKAWWLRDLT